MLSLVGEGGSSLVVSAEGVRYTHPSWASLCVRLHCFPWQLHAKLDALPWQRRTLHTTQWSYTVLSHSLGSDMLLRPTQPYPTDEFHSLFSATHRVVCMRFEERLPNALHPQDCV